jgi:UrcA family protein
LRIGSKAGRRAPFSAAPNKESADASDLDLNTDAGTRELLNRLSKAADRICRDGPISALAAYGYYRCYRRTLAAAVDKVHHEQVSALFAAMSRPNTR